ncbi:MAB_1171c family putative transporter, partial [Streptomyces boluensis]|uniref:MAB_1171c family putative transporter n=1 Tax=Streptomyces boluensis TaxID=1775135 RepID=UPI0016525A16
MAALAIAFAAKLPALIREWRNPLVRSVCFLIVAGCCGFAVSAPPSIAAINRLTGIANFAAPLAYWILCAFSGTCLLVIISWRGGTPGRRTRTARAWTIAYATAIMLVPGLFALGDAPVERLRDFDTYYANTPYIREMITLYLSAHLASAVVTITMCWRWARQVHQWLRVGLVVLVIGFSLNGFLAVAKLTAVIARWTGHDLDYLSTYVAPPAVAVGALVVTIGFLLPLLGPRAQAICRAWLMYGNLTRLSRDLGTSRRSAVTSPGIPWWSGPELRMTQRETEIHDRLLRLSGHLDDGVRTEAVAAAHKEAKSAEESATIAVAAMLTAAIHAQASGAPAAEPSADAEAALSLATRSGPQDLVALARALRSPVVTALGQTAS